MRNHTQQDVIDWVRRTFGNGWLNDRERALRFLEEALELVQAIGLQPDDVEALTQHVYARPIGDPAKEIGGVMITLEALSEHLSIDMDAQANADWDRINSLPQSHFDAATKRKEDGGVQHVQDDPP